ncbi:hypothetical protein CEUSTIGMA_g8683.t1 [Chlamydomonas eustigma]|uniref:Uncharacterized protein n=1 Tax=Chlamydomonas eustigma TaxID=1157962 RepID=A0A250XDY1_9CHLO|nr:hypothetical protein CEUSTIGMA_g8683.t1 [Chlamydomonas eustigma]|eukprot:GAX81251.1 hypothetical protein CEUSTIGMA_g8683.t1 [Chlamydomonas eustigma]
MLFCKFFCHSLNAMTSLDIVQDLENYLSMHTLDAQVKEMMVECLKTRPEEPMSWMMKYFLKQNAGLATSDCAVASAADQSTFVAISHEDASMQQYLTDKKVHVFFLEMLKQIMEAKPDNVLSFTAVVAHNLHKSPPPALEATLHPVLPHSQ